MRNITNILFFSLLLSFVSCNNNSNNITTKEVKQNIDNNENQGNFKTLSDTVISTISLDMIQDKPPIFKHFDKTGFLDSLIYPVINGKVKGYDFFDFTLLSPEEIKENLDMNKDTIYVENPETKDTTVKVSDNFEMSNIRELVFIEKWSWDNKTKKIKKETIAYGPVIYVVKDDSTAGYPVTKRVPFVILCN